MKNYTMMYKHISNYIKQINQTVNSFVIPWCLFSGNLPPPPPQPPYHPQGGLIGIYLFGFCIFIYCLCIFDYLLLILYFLYL